MGCASSLPLEKDAVDELRKETGFSMTLLVSLYRRFVALDSRRTGTLCRADFLKIKKFAKNPLRDRILKSFFPEDNSELSFPDFLRVVACFRPAVEGVTPEGNINGRHSKLKMTFQMFDKNGDGKICREDMLDALKAMMRVDVSEEELMSVTDQAFLEADENSDGFIDFDEFVKMTEKVEFEEKLSLRFLVA